ncbi:MAG TPA: hypothetical protein ENK91_04505 [Bacteroidetes bacterium]|nr:hypothetical protein [Bacteroidota bacterium]
MTAYDTLIQEGIQKGRKEGKIEGYKEVILNGWKKGATIEFLADITGLSIKEVEDIIKEYDK